MKWNIGNIEIEGKIVMAPMAGISNPAYIGIVQEMGAGVAFTELISAEAIVRDNKKTLEMLNGLEKISIPVGVQLFGSNAKTLAKAAQIVTKLYPNVFIDINMGCPVPKVAIKNEAGSALLKNPTKIKEIVTTIVDSVDVPVTVKIRSGWDDNSINAIEVAKIIEAAGASAISVHARTRKQGYSGLADWNIIKDVVNNISIPVIGNGDVKSCYDAKRMLGETGCTAVMIGRGLLGNPWLIKECNDYLLNNIEPTEISLEDKIKMMKYHLEQLTKFKNEKVAVLEMRTHLMNYLKGLPNNKEIKIQICRATSKEELLNIIDSYYKENK